ncbi:MAG: hypothetical protein MSH40_05255 [Christensenella sp.]|nr:hypothetical protein [Christensenella sp.]
MKKSTLITTIAMIVVVVVALSTATYAWFSASSIAVANVNMTTQASADWALVLGNKTGSTVSFAGASSDQIDISDKAFAGLYSPIAAINTKISKALQATYADGATFYTATKSGGTVTQNGNAVAKDPAFIRVVNTAKDAQKHLVLKVVLVLADGSKASTSSFYAAAATKFAICNDKGLYATNGYDWVEGITSGAESGAEIASSASSGYVSPSGSTLKTATDTNASEFNYTNPNLTTYFTTVGETPNQDETNMGLVTNNTYVTYEVDFGNIARNDYVNLAIYTWIDGWTADASAANATFTIRYAFTSKNA